ncbi:response regulator [Methanonatronarchaeum sp. AMET-Sl]|uniref:response regulator n=1 Tax=Methanonatronarchaeum sp. AMET-Sl TaxID=3037654 RepID=UPI00244DDB05|nr:response regulator [Methanonatronarchaeum sp. AMET-Sl]WGI17721.1 response regulator [Methanonatronarchaeum sp. AMET-Sl]
MFSVVLVDDDKGFLDLSKTYLESYDGIEIKVFDNPKNVLDYIERDCIDCIVSDYQMPDMDSLNFLKKVRDRRKDLPFIMFTGKGREEVAMEALNLGADRYLQKGGDPKSQYNVLYKAIVQEVDHYKTKENFNYLIKTLSLKTGEDLFESIVSELIDWFDVDGACVGEIKDGDRVSALSLVLDGEKIDEFSYPLEGSPCHQVTQEGPCLFRENVQEKFPEDNELKELSAEGYVGVPIVDGNEIIGVVWAVSRDKLDDIPSNWREILELLASRVNSEIKKLKWDKELKRQQDDLEKSIKRYRQLIEASPNTILIINKKTKEIIDGNMRSEDLLKKPRREIIGSKLFDYIQMEKPVFTEKLEKLSLENNEYVVFDEIELNNHGQEDVIVKYLGVKPRGFAV